MANGEEEVQSSVVSTYKAFNRWREGFSKSAGQYAHSSVDNMHTLVSTIYAGWGLGPENPVHSCQGLSMSYVTLFWENKTLSRMLRSLNIHTLHF